MFEHNYFTNLIDLFTIRGYYLSHLNEILYLLDRLIQIVSLNFIIKPIFCINEILKLSKSNLIHPNFFHNHSGN